MALVKVDGRMRGKVIVSAELATSAGVRKVAVSVFGDMDQGKIDPLAAKQGVEELHKIQQEMRDGTSKRGGIQ